MRLLDFRLSKWHAKHLLAAWCVYWAGVALWGVAAVLPAVLRATRPDGHGNVSVNFDGGAIQMTVIEGTTTLWKGGIGFQPLLFLLALPPLALWAWWLWAQRRRPFNEPVQIVDGSRAERDVPPPDVVREQFRKRSDR